MLSICKPRVLRAAGPCCSSSAGARRPRCCAVLSAAAGARSGCYRPRSSSSSIARAGAAAAGRVGSLRLACVARAVGPKDEEPAAPEAQAAARAAQQQQAARAKCFYAAAARAFKLQTRRAPPPEPPPLSALPDEPLPADSIPPLLEWVTTARMRPVAVQSILEQHCSPGVRRIVAAAARLLAEAEQEEQSQEDKGGGGGILITSAHLALAALAEHDGDVDCAAALGVLHHSAAGLSLQRCAEVLAWRAAQEQRWRETRRYEDSGSGKGNSSGSSIFSAPALHFVFQSYRWAVFTGCDKVQPCHLLWALAADPRLSYSPLRTDPLDGRVAAAEVREPPLVWLLQQFPKELPRPAAVYEQLLGVVQLGLQRQVAAASVATATAFACGGSTTGAGGKFAGAYGGLITQLDGLAGWPSTERSLDDLAALLRACRLAGHVPSRQQLQAADSLLARCVMQPRGTFVPSFWHGRWPAVVELAEAFAALGRKMVAVDEFDVNRGREHSRLQLAAAVAAAAATDVFDRVQALCRAGAALRFCFATELLRGTRIPDELWRESMAMATAAPASAPLRARVLQALLAITDLPADVPWLPTLAAELADAAAAHADPEDMAALKTVREAPLCYVSGDTARIAVCVALQTADTGLAARWRAGGLQRQDGVDVDVDMEAVAAVAASLRCGMPLPARVQLLHALNEIRKHGNMPSFVVWLHAVLASSIDLDSSSIHASLRTQRRVAAAYAAAGCGVPEGWLRQLVSYGDEVGGGSSKGAAEALQVVLRAAASGSGAPALASCGGGNANTSSTSSGTATSQMKVLCQLAKLLERNAAAGWLSPHATQAVLGHLQALAEAAAGRDGINSLAASCGPATAILALAATRPGTPAALDPELLSALSDMTGSELPCMVGGEQQQQLKALMNWHTHKQHY